MLPVQDGSNQPAGGIRNVAVWITRIAVSLAVKQIVAVCDFFSEGKGGKLRRRLINLWNSGAVCGDYPERSGASQMQRRGRPFERMFSAR